VPPAFTFLWTQVAAFISFSCFPLTSPFGAQGH
jgi:hypothetical protein